MSIIEEIGDLGINLVLSKLGTEDIASVSCVSKKFRDSASEDSLWYHVCSRELDLSSPVDPQGNPTSSFKEAYRLWREAFDTYPWPLVRRVKKCWGRLENWVAINFPEAAQTLQRGATEAEIEELENTLKVKLPLPTRLLYRFHNGQTFTDEDVEGLPINLLGLIGGYSFYDHLVHVYLLPLKQIILETKEVIRQLGFSTRSKFILVAASSTYSQKLFFLNCSDGQLYVGTRNIITDGEMIPCVPKPLISFAQDGMLLWLEEHGRRLQSGVVNVCTVGKVRYINLFPRESPCCSTAVTSGVEVSISNVFVPEMSDLQEEANKYLFSYSIRMRLTSEGCIVDGMHFGSCQLYWRHWIIRANDSVVSDVNGEAVIGKFPLLKPGGEEFRYESCTSMPSSPVSIEGSFTFVPGRLAEPKGSQFEVEIPRLALELPEYIF